jgi:uncharacterized protein YbaA (DUF1428 family)
MTPSVDEARRRLAWPAYHQRLVIEDRKTSRLVSYQPNQVQQRLDDAIMSQVNTGKPVRIIGLKSRRMGFSTHTQARFAHLAFTSRTFHGVTGAHLDESSSYLHGMSETMYSHLPAPLRPMKKTGIQGRRMVFTTGSSLRTFTAGGREGVGRAQAARAIHGSEVAYWPDASGTLTALLQIVPNEPGTIVMLESTANGVGNAFHDHWQKAVAGESDYLPVFFAWHDFPDYQLTTSAAIELLGREPAWSDREQALRASGVTAEQLAWRRWAIANLCSGDERIFDQEYPDTPAVAFLTSGRPYFGAMLDAFRPVVPIRTGAIAGNPFRGGSSLRFEPDPHGPLRIWTLPKPGRRYLIFGDVAGGVTLEEHEARPVADREDYCCAQVVDRETGEQVAEWHARIDPDLYGVELAKLGWLFGGKDKAPAMIAVESTGGYGIAVLAKLYRELSYPNLYTRRRLDTYTQKWSEELGWDTNRATRPVMLDSLRAMLREHPEHLRSEGLRGEMTTFVVRRSGRPAADSGCHDDRVMAMAGALEVWREHAQRPIRLSKPKASANHLVAVSSVERLPEAPS